jgi:hypothetical protein
MKLLSQITIARPTGNAVIELLHGDLTAIPKKHATDILVVSAYPGSYAPVGKTLMAALYQKGIIVEDLAKNKEMDLLNPLGCWLSKPLTDEQQEKFHIKRILCFEPGELDKENESVVGNIFRCINTFAFDNQNNVIAMPVVATGNQKIPLEKMLPAMMDTSIFWLEKGLPLKCIKFVLFGDDQVKLALPLFNKGKQRYELQKAAADLATESPKFLTISVPGKKFSSGIDDGDESSGKLQISRLVETYSLGKRKPSSKKKVVKSTPPAVKKSEYDFFISYAHTHSSLINSFVKSILKENKKLKIFYDKNSIPPGGLWIKQLSDSIQKARKVLVFLSPDYNNSPVCWDEFQCAKLLEYDRKTEIIQTIYLYDYKKIKMPPIMGIYSYIDCREGDKKKLKECIHKIVSR